MSQFNSLQDKSVEKILIHKAKTLQDRQNKAFYMNAGVIGIYGGNIIIPIVLGLIFGGYLQQHFPVGKINWRISCIFIGFVLGYINASLWIHRVAFKDFDNQNNLKSKLHKRGKHV